MKSGIRPDFYHLSTATSFQKQWYDILGIDPARILTFPPGAWVQASQVVTTSLINNWREVRFRGYEHAQKCYLPPWFPEIHAPFRPRGSVAFGSMIYVSREKAHYRKPTNEQEVRHFLESRGFVTVELENMMVAEQIDVFNRAVIVVGTHGAGLANITFCPPDARLLELFPPSYRDSSFRLLSQSLGLGYGAVAFASAERRPAQTHPQREDFVVDMKLLGAALDRVLNP
jgi:hypothetical protein